jgi:hypothetical protein
MRNFRRILGMFGVFSEFDVPQYSSDTPKIAEEA